MEVSIEQILVETSSSTKSTFGDKSVLMSVENTIASTPTLVITDGTISEDGDIDSNSTTSNESAEDIDHQAQLLQRSRNDSTSVEKDSGVECLDDFTLPDAELMARIVSQVEAYFSNENLVKDAFLLKHIKRNKEGFVSLKLVASFRKVKAINKNWKVVAYSIKNGSSKLEVNETFTKVRRVEPLPTIEQKEVEPQQQQQQQSTPSSKSVLAYNFPFEKATVANISQLFASCGDISSVRIIRPDEPIPSYLKQLSTNNESIGKITSAIIEFEDNESATNAVNKAVNNKDCNWRNNLTVCQLSEFSRSQSVRSPSKNFLKNSENNESKSNGESNKGEKKQVKKRQKRDKSEIQKISPKSDVSESSHLSSSCSENEVMYNNNRPRSNSSSLNSYYMRKQIKYNNEPAKERLQPIIQRQKSNSYSGGDPINVNQSRSCHSSPTHLARQPTNVIRMPRGPDGSKGFQSLAILRARSFSAPFPITGKA